MATISQIAERAGVSPYTVSRVLNGKAKETWPSMVRRADRIRAIAVELGYRPNASARAIRSGRFEAVSMVLSTAGSGRSVLPEAMLRSISESLERRGMHLIVSALPDETLTDARYMPKALREWAADGMLVNYNKRIPYGIADLLERYSIPAVWINAKRDCDGVTPDDRGAGAEATRKLLVLGHRRIAWLNHKPPSHPNAHYSEGDRREGYREAMREAGLSECLLDEIRGRRDGGGEAVLAERLRAADRPTGFVVYGRAMVVELMLAVRTVGLEIPRDLSVITFGGAPVMVSGCVDTMLVPEAEMGRCAVDMVCRKIDQPQRPLASRSLAFGHKAGRTLAAAGS